MRQIGCPDPARTFKPNEAMSTLTAYLGLAIFPFAFIFGFSLNPISFNWALHHGSTPMPDEIRDRATTFSRYANFLGDALILVLVTLLARKASISSERLGLNVSNWIFYLALGFAAGGGQLVLQSLISKYASLSSSDPFVSNVRAGSIFLWIVIFVVGAFSEELWIAFCLVALKATGHSAALSISVTAIVFAIVHYGYRLGGVIAVGLKATASALLFLWTGSLIPMFLFHLIGNWGSLHHARRASDEIVV